MTIVATNLQGVISTLAVHDDRLYFISDYGDMRLGRVSTSGGPVTVVEDSTSTTRALAVTPHGLILLGSNLVLLSFDESTRQILLEDQYGATLSVRPDDVYVAKDSLLSRVHLPDGAIDQTTVSPGPSTPPEAAHVTFVGATEQLLFVVSSVGVEKRGLDLSAGPFAVAEQPFLVAAPNAAFFNSVEFTDAGNVRFNFFVWPNEGDPRPLFENPDFRIGLLATDGDGLYTAEDGALVHRDTATGAPNVLARGFVGPSAFTMDDRCFYVADATTIVRIPRP